MIRCLVIFLYITVINAKHFNGGTIRWMPIDPFDNSSTITIVITQTYWWTYPTITCTNAVPISTAGRSNQNANLTCVTDCSTDGGYSMQPIDILTDCISVSSSLGILTSQRSVNISLASTAHFYLANVGSAWASLNYPAQNNLEWSILTFIDLRMRPDGFINTPPEASVISPQFVIVNRTSQIQIDVSDVNVSDDVRCRWSKYTPGYRKRKRSNEDEYINQESATQARKTIVKNGEIILSRKKRATCATAKCQTQCRTNCPCNCTICLGTTCNGTLCESNICQNLITISTTTTLETPGTLQLTSSYPHRQAIDECGGICYPGSVPIGTTLSNCTLSFTGLISDTWYAVAIQIEDFINTTATTPMSSVPVQFLIYVMPEPTCLNVPIILPLTDCLEVTVGISTSFNLSVLNLCDVTISNVTDIVVSLAIADMQVDPLMPSPTNLSLSYVTLMWTPQASQIGSQQLCMTAYTDEQLQSEPYCVTFTVITSSEACKTTTSTSTTTSTETSTSSTTTTITTTTTTTTSTTATTSTTTTTTSITTSSTTTTSTSSASITMTSTLTTATTTVAVIAVAETTTTTTNPEKSTSWELIAGISSVALPLALCAICCLYRLLWSPNAKLRRAQADEENKWAYNHLTSSTESMLRTTTPITTENNPIEVPRKSYQVYNILSQKSSANSVCSTPDSEGSILVAIYNNTNARRVNNLPTYNTKESIEMTNTWMHPSTDTNFHFNRQM